jgi:hypothetical protein
LVFHVFNNVVSSADIQAQIERLNTDFFTPAHPYLSDERYQNPDAKDEEYGLAYLHPADRQEGFAQKAAPTLIRFCLPLLDPDGQPTSGIVAVSSAVTAWTVGDSIKNPTLGGSKAWDTQLYCNVWIAPLTGYTAGFAQMPGGPAGTDGIVIDADYFRRADGSVPADLGTNDYALGRTLVHLMGSYLNLHELWNDYVLCQDDYVEDTPIHNAPNIGKGTYQHVSTCDGNPVEMTMNLMDSSNDTTMYMFTWGQATRMQATLSPAGPRAGLALTSTQCTTGGGFQDIETERQEKPPHSPSSTFDVKVVPNPNNGVFTIQINAITTSDHPRLDLILVNALGEIVWQKSIQHQDANRLEVPIAVGYLPKGIYTLQVAHAQGVKAVHVVVE